MRYFYITAILEVPDSQVSSKDVFEALKKDAGVRADLKIETSYELTNYKPEE